MLIIDDQRVPGCPAAGKTALFQEPQNHRLTYKDDSGRTYTLGGAICNWNTDDVIANGADTYIQGSDLRVPTDLQLQAGTAARWRIFMTKTAAGVAAPSWVIRTGTLGTVADTARITLTQVEAQTAAVDAAFVDIIALLRTGPGPAGSLMRGGLCMNHQNAATGFSTLTTCVLAAATLGGWDTTVPNLIIGLSVNPGAAAVWTITEIMSELLNI